MISIDKAKWIMGWMSTEELSFLADAASKLGDNSIIYEIGSFCGRSSRAMADNSPISCKIYCIDPWDFKIPTYNSNGDLGEPIIINKITYEQFCTNLNDHIMSGRVTPVISNWENFDPPERADFIFIDGNHSYEAAKYDIQKSLEYIKPNGIIAGHNYNSFPGVNKAVDEFFQKVDIHIKDTIWWVRVGEAAPKIEVKEKKVMIGLSTGEHIRKAEFLPYFMALERPLNSLTVSVHGQSPAKSRNLIAEAAIENNCTHILFLDDDMILPKDTLMKLLAHDKDVVTALYLLRTFPHYPAMFDKKYENGKCRFAFLTPGKKGLIPVVNGGLGCVLISVEVFKKLEKPWVRLAEIAKDEWCDDIGFFNRVSEAGFEIFCDLDTQVGHILSVHMWPEMNEGSWFTNYKHLTGNVRIPQNIPGVKEVSDEESAQLV